MLQPTITPSPEFQRQIDLLKLYPEIFDRHFHPAMQDAAELVKETVRERTPHRTGRLQGALGSKVFHAAKSVKLSTRAVIGFGKRFGMQSARIVGPVNNGAVAHEVAARNEDYMHFSSRGRHTITRSIQHPGFQGFHMLEEGLAAAESGIDARMAAAMDQVVTEMTA